MRRTSIYFFFCCKRALYNLFYKSEQSLPAWKHIAPNSKLGRKFGRISSETEDGGQESGEARPVAIHYTILQQVCLFPLYLFCFDLIGFRERFWSFCYDSICRFQRHLGILFMWLGFSACYINLQPQISFYFFIFWILSATPRTISYKSLLLKVSVCFTNRVS